MSLASANKIPLFTKLLVLGLFFSLLSCKTTVPVEYSGHVDAYLRDTIPYTLASHEPISDRLLIFLPPILDTVEFEKTDLYQSIYESGYDILCIYQAPAKGTYYYSRKAMEFKGQQIQNAQNLISLLKQQKRIAKPEHTILMGIDQGAYMGPLLMANNGFDTAIYINSSVFSSYMSLQRIASGKMEWNEARQKFVKRKFGIDSLSTFKEKVADVERLSSEQYSLGSFTNMYWLSYHANFMLEEYQKSTAHSFWLFFDDYPLYKESDYEYLKLLDQTRSKGSGNYHVLSGYNGFSEANWEDLEALILPYFLKEQS